MELQDQKLHIIEGEFLQALIERVVRWRDNYKSIIQRLRTSPDETRPTDQQVNISILINSRHFILLFSY